MQNYLQIFISLFAIMNPLLALTIYLDITKSLSKAEKSIVIIVCGITVFIILNLCLYIGQPVLKLLDIHSYALQLGGGIIILIIGIMTVIKTEDRSDRGYKSSLNELDKNRLINMGVSPLALPMIVGPGGIALTILYSQAASSIASKLIITIIITLLSVVIVLFFFLADIIHKVMGDLGVVVLNKIMGLLLTAIAFEMLIDGVKASMHIIMHS